MPELPEVETVVRTLEYQLGNCTIDHVDVFWDKIIHYPEKEEFCNILKQKTIKEYRRLGKYLIFDLDTHILVAHMRMEGKFYVGTKDDAYDRKHTHVIFYLSDGRVLRYHDTRKFGRMEVYEKNNKEDGTYPCFKNVGYDAFDERLTAKELYEFMHSRKIYLKQALLDQKMLAGIGNIYADEICFACGLHPMSRCCNISKKDCELILFHTRRILNGAIKAGGTTIRSYTSQLGVDGRFQLQLKVHQKENQICPICGTTILKTKVAGRGTYLCKQCQKRK